jgi:iron-sulfur cluster repair protein YtfE (RIC family)
MDRPTERFRRQHKELVKLAGELMQVLDVETLTERPDEACRRLARFTGKLKVHAAMENSALYPRLLESAHAPVRDEARKLFLEVGELYDHFAKYSERWCSAATVQDDPEGFSTETMSLLQRLGQRMMRENEQLYPLVDAWDEPSP